MAHLNRSSGQKGGVVMTVHIWKAPASALGLPSFWRAEKCGLSYGKGPGCSYGFPSQVLKAQGNSQGAIVYYLGKEGEGSAAKELGKLLWLTRTSGLGGGGGGGGGGKMPLDSCSLWRLRKESHVF